MLDIKLIRENPKIVEDDLKRRGKFDKIKLLHDLIKYDKQRRDLIKRVEKLKHLRNILTREIAELKAKKKSIAEKMKEVKTIPDKIKKLDSELAKMNEKCNNILMRLPNLLHESVPIGKAEEDNVPIRYWGKKPKIENPLDHIDLGLKFDLIELEKAAKVAGARFYYLKNELVLLNEALIRFGLDFMRRKGYILHQTPYLLRRKAIAGATDLADFEEMIYKVEGEDLYLLATSEHALLALHMDEIFDGNKLPIKYCGLSPCFRKEAGSHGRDTKGIFRVHQFEKVEQFIFCKPQDSWNFHEELIANAEEVLKILKIPYRVMNVCTGDIGTVAAKKYDLEAWLPGQNKYREVASCSNCTDYQARRSNIRYRVGKEITFLHTLNSTLIATERLLIAILENYQEKDCIRIPDALQSYMKMKKIMR